MSNLAAQPDAPSDAELISRVRAGDQAAYGQLFERHREAAHRMARQLARGPDIDDLISEAFTKVFVQLQRGGGPDVAFRAYLLTAIRRLHVDRARTNQRVQVTDDLEDLDRGVDFVDPATSSFERGAASRAFASLPERWQLVLWHLEVEGQKPADIAPLLGMSPNSVAALAYRAREGLRQAYLQSHLADTADEGCRWTTEHLGAYIRKGLAKRDSTKVENHLEGCHRCTAVYLELTEVNSNLSGLLAPALLGLAAPGYLAAGGTKLGLLLLWPWTKLKEAGAGAQAGAAAAAVTAVVAAAAVAGVFGGGDDDAKEAVEPSTQQIAPDSNDSSPDNNASPDSNKSSPDSNNSSPDSNTPPDQSEPAPGEQPPDEEPPDEEPPPDEEDPPETDDPPENDTPPDEAPDTPTDVSADLRGSNVMLRWDPVDGARGYRVYRKTSPATTPTGVATTSAAPSYAVPATYSIAPATATYPAARPGAGPVISGGVIEETSFRDTSLLDGNKYRYVVTAVAGGQESRISKPVKVTYDPKPSAPSGADAVETASGIKITWDRNKEPDLDGYRIYRDGGRIATSEGARYVDDNAPSGKSRYTVTAIDESGHESPESDSVASDPAPAAPTGVTAVEVKGGIEVTWNANDDSDIAGYVVLRDGVSIGRTSDSTSVTDHTAAPNTTYEYVVRVIDESGQSTESQPVSAQWQPPAAPTGLATGLIGDNAIEVTWAPNDETDLDGYIVTRNGVDITGVIPNTTYVDSNLDDGAYKYSVIAVDIEGNRSTPSTSDSETVDTAPSKPTGITCDLEGTELQLDWNDNPEPDIAEYAVTIAGRDIGTYTESYAVDPESHRWWATHRVTITAIDNAGNQSDATEYWCNHDPADEPDSLGGDLELEGELQLDTDPGEPERDKSRSPRRGKLQGFGLR